MVFSVVVFRILYRTILAVKFRANILTFFLTKVILYIRTKVIYKEGNWSSDMHGNYTRKLLRG